ncbi:MAG: hypothetical protein SPI30_01440 [Prevotella sp.]|nr:hypothetical protein [Prevotella sp.]
MIPAIGTRRTNGWYCGYQRLVRVVPSIGTMAVGTRKKATNMLPMS